MKQNNFSSFDSAANAYDTDFTRSEIGKAQRVCVHQFIEEKALNKNNLSILEINCGTGEDALWFANKGNKVLATDASLQMIEVARQKKLDANDSSLHFEQAPFSELKSKYSNKQFDLLFSNFGGLNCVDENELKNLMRDFSKLVKPNGKMVLVIMGRKCFWERIYFLIKGNFKKAFRRMSKGPVPAHLGQGIYLDTYYYSPMEIKLMAADFFTFKEVKPVGIAIPPSYLEPFFNPKKRFLKILVHLEKVLGNFSFLANYADHYLIHFEKREDK